MLPIKLLISQSIWATRTPGMRRGNAACASSQQRDLGKRCARVVLGADLHSWVPGAVIKVDGTLHILPLQGAERPPVLPSQVFPGS